MGSLGESSFTGEGNSHLEFIVCLYSRSIFIIAGGKIIVRLELFLHIGSRDLRDYLVSEMRFDMIFDVIPVAVDGA